jgi:hypothetical protein
MSDFDQPIREWVKRNIVSIMIKSMMIQIMWVIQLQRVSALNAASRDTAFLKSTAYILKYFII